MDELQNNHSTKYNYTTLLSNVKRNFYSKIVENEQFFNEVDFFYKNETRLFTNFHKQKWGAWWKFTVNV